MADAKKFYRSLTLHEKRFIGDKTMSTTMSVKNWIAFLSRASAYDAYRDKMASGSGWFIALGVMATIGSTIAYLQLEIPWLIAIPAISASLTAWLIMRQSTLKNRDLNNYLRLFFMPFLRMMEDFAGPEAKLSAAVDFRDAFKYNKPTSSKVKGRNLEIYSAKYMVGKITFKDGAYLETIIADDIKKFSYKNANGKSKSKTKTTHHYFIRLSLPKQTYRSKKLKPLLRNLTLEETNETLIYKLKGKAKEMNYGILKLNDFQKGIKHIYMQVENITVTPTTETPNEAKDVLPKPADKNSEGFTADTESSIPAAFWASNYFHDIDYRNTDFRNDVPLVIDEENNLNIFES
jgi:hypothetical protein